jgi:hypothetical protein
MRDDDILSGSLMEDTWLTLEQVAAACTVEPEWLARHIDDGTLPPRRMFGRYLALFQRESGAGATHVAVGARLRRRAGIGRPDGRSDGRIGYPAPPPTTARDQAECPHDRRRLAFRRCS